jgi:Raf kinase inhibitor-like YbhB/YbcL family protein
MDFCSPVRFPHMVYSLGKNGENPYTMPFKLMLFILMVAMINVTPPLSVTSPAFDHGATIPSKYTCEGQNTSPELSIKDIPKEAKSLVLIMDDPDAPGKTFDHWVMWNIPPHETIMENSAPGVQGKNGRGTNKYIGPCPPSGQHHYYFKVYALDKMLDLPAGSDKSAVEAAMHDHVICSGQLIGLYQKKGKD